MRRERVDEVRGFGAGFGFSAIFAAVVLKSLSRARFAAMFSRRLRSKALTGGSSVFIFGDMVAVLSIDS